MHYTQKLLLEFVHYIHTVLCPKMSGYRTAESENRLFYTKIFLENFTEYS